MALVMIIVEVVSALLAPAAEFAAPVIVLFGEVLFWVALLVTELIIALIRWRKPKMPSKPQFSGARGKLKSFSNNWRSKRANKKQRSESS
jgi:hypothetical protein